MIYNCFIFLAKVSTKDLIAQDILTHEAIYKNSKLLDQFCDGLKRTPVFCLMRAFPEEFLPFFTYTGCLAAADVVDALVVSPEAKITEHDELVLKFLRSYIENCNQEGKRMKQFCCVFPPMLLRIYHSTTFSRHLI